MAYEIDFIALSDSSNDSDAIAMRWKKENGDGYVIGVIDGGFASNGEKVVDHLNEYYFKDRDKKIIDFIICSHADKDHASGLTVLLDSFDVKKLYVNLPWNYIDELIEKKKYGNTTEKTLTKHLKSTYQYLDQLEQAANQNGVKIMEAFQGVKIEEKIKILSPNKEFFLNLICKDERTDLLEYTVIEKNESSFIDTYWDDEDHLDDPQTTPINETSVVLFGDIDEGVLFTGDAGVEGLNCANEYAESIGITLKEKVSIYKIPHHGSKHNLDTSTLDNIVGQMVKENSFSGRGAFVMCGIESDNPKKSVVNAFLRRGVKVYVSKGNIIHHHKGNMPQREGWASVKAEEFSNRIEK